jgi:hypothetical protein
LRLKSKSYEIKMIESLEEWLLISVTLLKKHTGTNIAEWNNKKAEKVEPPSRFKLTIPP